MKGKTKLRSVVALLLAFILMFVGIDPIGWMSGTMDEVQAEELTEITWADFAWNNTALVNGQSFDTDRLAKYSGTTLNNTAFEGDVSIPSGSGFRYAVPSSWYGLTIQESSGNLLIAGKGQVAVNGTTGTAYTLKAGDYGLTTFTDKRFTIRIELYNLSSDNLSANVNIYVNGKTVGEGITLTGSSAHANYNLGTGIGFAQNGLEGGITIYDVQPALTEITWADFAWNNTALVNGQSFDTDRLAKYSGTTLNNTAFEGDVSIPSGSGFRYAVPSSWYGLTIQESSGNLLIAGKGAVAVNGTTGTAYTLKAGDYGLTTFTDTRFTIRIELYNLSSDNLSANVNISVNGKVVGEGITLTGSSSHANYNLGTGIGFAQNGLEGGITIYDVQPALKEITWADFAWNNTALVNGQSFDTDRLAKYSGTTLNNTAFEGDVSIPSGSGFRYAGTSSWHGLTIKESSGNLLIAGTSAVTVNGTTGTAYTLNAEDYGLSTFTDKRFTIRIELYDLSDDNSSATVNIYINGKTVGEGITLKGTAVTLGNGVGFAQNGLEGGITIYDVQPALKEITWADFAWNNTALVNGQSFDTDRLAKYSGTTLNNTAFEGDVSIPSGSGFRYAGTSSWHGLTIKESSGNLLIAGTSAVTVNGVNGTAYTLNAEDYGLSTFTDKRFTIRIELYDLSDDNSSAAVNISINGKTVGEGITLKGTAVTLGNGVGFAQNNLAGGITIYDVQPALKEITWADFKRTSNSTALANGDTITTETLAKYTGDTLNNTAFEGDVSIPSGSGFRYAGTSTWHGLTIKESSGNLLIAGTSAVTVNGTTGTAYTLNAEDYGLSTFTDKRFTIRIELYDLSSDNLSAAVNIYINGKTVGEGITLKGTAVTLGNGVGFVQNGLEGGITVYDIAPTLEEVVTGLEVLSWEEFGYTGGVTTTASMKRAASHLDNLQGYLFNGDVVMQAGTQIRYAETSDASAGGVSVMVDSNGVLKASIVNAGTASRTYTAIASHHDLDSFVDTQFNLKIAYTSDGEISVWINNAIVGNPFKTNLTFGTTIYMVNAGITPISLRTTAPTDLTEISFDDWTKEGVDDVSIDGYLKNSELRGAHSTRTDLFDTSLHEVVKLVDTNDSVGCHTFVYGGCTENAWLGIRIAINDAGEMTIHCVDVINGTSTTVETFTIDPVKAGVGTTFRGEEFSWKLDTKRLGNHVLLYMSFNGNLYNNAPFVFHDFADSMTAAMYYTSHETTSEVDNCYVILGASTKELPVLYHDLTKGNYSIPAYKTVTFYEKDASGAWTETSTPTTLTATGDYKLEFNDGVSDYTQIISCYQYETDVDAAALVRGLKMWNGKEETDWNHYETRLCDTDYDGKVDADDVNDIRSMLLETYEADTDVMKISGFFSPTASLIEDATYETIKATGVNHIIESNMYYSDDAMARYRVYQELSYAQKYGLTVTVQDKRLTDIGANNQTATKADVETYVANYKDYQSFGGLFIIDEPKAESYPNVGVWQGYTQVENYSSVAKAIAAAGYEGWSNAFSGNSDLFSNSYNGDAGRRMRYGYYQYLGNLVDSFGLNFMSATQYPFLKNTSSADADMLYYFMNLAMTKDVATEKNIELRTFVQAMAADEDDINTSYNEAQLKWNANMNLTFGTSALEYFPLVQPDSFQNYEDGTCASGLLDKDGRLTQFGSWAMSVNQQVQAIDDILLNATHEGFMSVGSDSYATTVARGTIESIEMKTGGWIDSWSSTTLTNTFYDAYEEASVTSSDTEYGAFAGCFEITAGEYNGKHAMYIVNFNDAGDNTITVNLGDAVTSTAIYQGVEEEHTGTFNITLAAGEAVLVVY